MIITRRKAIFSTLFGSGLVGLRALATGLPASFLLDPRKALADGTCASQAKAQFILMSTCGTGDPLNANCPGSYVNGVTHPDWTQPLKGYNYTTQTTQIALGGQQYTAAPPWAVLKPDVLARSTFWHLKTNTPVHPKEPDVLKLMGATPKSEMLPSMLAQALAPCLGTIQAQPISLGAANPAEALSFGGAPQPVIPPLALRSTLTSAGPLAALQPLRDQTMNSLYDLYKNGASPAQKAYIDEMVTSQQQVRNINQNLLSSLDQIKDNSVASQIIAAIALIQMKITPVLSLHIPWGGDNHRDIGLATEAQQTADAVASIQSLMDALTTAKLQDQVTFMTLHVFGRTLGPSNTDGRQHNGDHQVSMTISSRFKPGVIGAVAPVPGADYGATNIDSKTGMGSSSGDITALDTLASFGMTMLAAVGADPSGINSPSTTGKVISAALASP
jgi:hypothetical protein